ncbi:hypothetical protein MF271_17075 (plasmid) [Deinococcus sp. KNUC1210]|uniref:hypothetical protein n=1 Tax=Deinococcus sp. KNUC1210 TaxID=2917691 RepID=UPI001EEFD6A5|nr:hypothetical protein [Deinococcus sp. KNUC1210]ULH17037.1 hypothetical protein MF271_17075 [Deinococcus sp. KNUC1210]
MMLSVATLQAVVALQEQDYIIGDPEVVLSESEGQQTAHITVFVPEKYFRLNTYLDLIYETLENTSTDTLKIEVLPELYEPPRLLEWDET